MERLPDPSDRRGVILKATEKGKALTLQAVTSHVEVERELVAGLSETEQKELASLLKHLILLQQQELNRNSLR